MIAAEADLAGDADRWAAPVSAEAAPAGSAFEVILPGPVSIARRMIEGWVASRVTPRRFAQRPVRALSYTCANMPG